MKVKYMYRDSRNLITGKIYEVVGENKKGDCYIIQNTDNGKVGVFKKYKFCIV